MAARKNVRRDTRRTDGSDTARDVLGWISDQVNFWSGDGQKPGETAALAQARDATRAVVGTGLRVADAYFTGGIAGSFGQNVVAPRAAVSSPTNRNQGIRAGGRQFARDAAVAGAGAATGYGVVRAAKVAKPVVSKATKPVVSKVTNKVRGEAVALHGSPTTGIRTVEPRWSITDVDRPTVSVMRTDIPRDLREPSLVEKYAGGSGSVYVVGVKKAETNLPKFPKGPWSGEPTVYTKSNAPARVLAEVRKQDYYMWDDFLDEIQKQVRLAGGGRFSNVPRTKKAADIARKIRRGNR